MLPTKSFFILSSLCKIHIYSSLSDQSLEASLRVTAGSPELRQPAWAEVIHSGPLRRVALASGLLPGFVSPLEVTGARTSARFRFRRSSFCLRSRLNLDLSPFNRDIADLLTRSVSHFRIEALGRLSVPQNKNLCFEAA